MVFGVPTHTTVARHFTNTHELCGKPDTTKAQMPVTVRLPWRSRQTESLRWFHKFSFRVRAIEKPSLTHKLGGKPDACNATRDAKTFFFFFRWLLTLLSPPNAHHITNTHELCGKPDITKLRETQKILFFLLVLVFPLIPLSPPNARLCTNIHASFGQLSAEAILVCKFSPLFCRGNSTYTHTDAG